MKHKRLVSALLVLLAVFFRLPSAAAWYGEACGVPALPDISGYAAFAVELNTGTVLLEQNADEQLYPASTTKLMTALIAMEHIEAGQASLDDVITFSREAVYGIPRDTMHIAIDVGEQLTVRQVFYAILLPSANEACLGMAEYIAGSADAFVALMNERAAALGMTHTHFVTTNGLHDPDHYMSARDLATLLQECIQHPFLVEVMSTPTYEIPPTNKCSETRYLTTTNDLLLPRSGVYNSKVVCGKTGYTTPAANTLATLSEFNDMQVIITILKAPKGTTFQNTSALVDYFAENLTLKTIDSSIDFAKSVPTASGDSLLLEPEPFSVLCHTQDDPFAFECVYEVPDVISDPAPAGTVFGTLTLYDHGAPVGQTRLVSRTDYQIAAATDPSGSQSSSDVTSSDSQVSSGAKKGSSFVRTLLRFLLILLCAAIICAVLYGVVLLLSAYLYRRKKQQQEHSAAPSKPQRDDESRHPRS